jgi:hypothetical protein
MRTCKLLFAAATVLVFVSSAQAGHFCHHCGCDRNCKKVCRLECGTKKETKTEYAAECEDFCVPGHSKKCGVKIECDCDGHHHRKVIWQPTCAKVHTRKKLVKKEVTKEVPDYKWVVEEYCCVCGQCVKVDAQAKGGCAEKTSDRLPLATAADGQLEPTSDEMTAEHGTVAFEQEVDDSEQSPEEADSEASPVIDHGTPIVREPRRPLRGLLAR